MCAMATASPKARKSSGWANVRNEFRMVNLLVAAAASRAENRGTLADLKERYASLRLAAATHLTEDILYEANITHDEADTDEVLKHLPFHLDVELYADAFFHTKRDRSWHPRTMVFEVDIIEQAFLEKCRKATPYTLWQSCGILWQPVAACDMGVLHLRLEESKS